MPDDSSTEETIIRVNGIYLGIGEGDESDEVAKIIDFARKKYTPARSTVPPGRLFTPALTAEIKREQAIFLGEGKLKPGEYIPGVVNLATKYAMGYLKPPVKPKPVIFTVEGHLSNLWMGPVASNAETLQRQGVCYWQPVGYDCAKLPFNNKDGVNQLLFLVGSQVLPDGTLFPSGTNWGIEGFSQGAMIVSDFMAQHVIPESGVLHWRLKDFKRGLALGNPRREYGKCAPWADNPPPLDTQGIMGDGTGKGTFVTTGTVIEDRWRENANEKDLFAQNTRDKAGLDKTAVARIITENSWAGGQAGIFARVLALFTNLPTEGLAAIKATIGAIMFLAANPNPHYTTVAEPGDIEWMRGVAV